MRFDRQPSSSTPPSFSRRKLYLAIAAISHLLIAGRSYGAPSGGQIVHGSGGIFPSGVRTTIDQTSPYLTINWDSFDVGSGHTVEFVQFGPSSVALNRVVNSNQVSFIEGTIISNGHVILVNPRGVIFEHGSHVDVGGFVASGLDVGLDDFIQKGEITFTSGSGAGEVINRGEIEARHADITLLGKSVLNANAITAAKGNVSLMAGKDAILTFDGDLLGVSLTETILQESLAESVVVNAGSITASGGHILLTASIKQELFSQAVNSGGLGRSSSVVVHDDGSFTLGLGGNVLNSGTLDVSSSNGAGQVTVLGENVESSGQILANGGDGRIELHARNAVSLTGSTNSVDDGVIAGRDITITAGRSGCDAGVDGCTVDDSRSIWIGADAALLADGNIKVFSADNITLEGDIGSDSHRPESLAIKAGNAISIGGSIHAGSPTLGTEPSIIFSAGDQSLSEAGFAVPTALSVPPSQPSVSEFASLTITGIINSHGGDVELSASYGHLADSSEAAAVHVSGDINTNGGSLLVGSEQSRVGSFTSENALRTDSETIGGNITIYSERDIEINSASFGGSLPESEATVGTLKADTQSGNIMLIGSYEYNSIKDNAHGLIEMTAHNGGIELQEFTSDDGSAGESRLSMTLVAKRDIDIQIADDAWLNGGDFSANSLSESIKIGGGTLHSEGGSVTLEAQNILLSGNTLNTAGDYFGRAGGWIAFNGNVRLMDNVTIITGNDEALVSTERGDIKFNGSLGSSENNAFNLNIISGDVEFNNDVSRLGMLDIDSSGLVQMRSDENGEHGIHVGVLDVAASDFKVGDIKTQGGNVTINVGAGEIDTGDIDTSGSVGMGGGGISLEGRTISVNNLNSNAGEGDNLIAGDIEMAAEAETDSSAKVSINGDVRSRSSGGEHRVATINFEGNCGDCENTISFNSESFISGTVSVTGSDAIAEIITVSNAASNWTINGNNTHEIRSHGDGNNNNGLISFSGFEELVGSGKVDHFEVTALPTSELIIRGAEEFGNSEPDVLKGPSSSAGGDSYEWLITDVDSGLLRLADGSSVGVRFHDIAHLDGGSADNAFVFTQGGAISGSIDGGDGSATIRGKDTSNTWNLTEEDGFSIRTTGLGERYLRSFSNINRLEGGVGDDKFIIETAFAGDIASGTGHDEFFIGSGGSVENIDGGVNDAPDSSATLHGRNVHNIWTINLENQGSLAAHAGTPTPYVTMFSNISHLVGGSQIDEFDINANFAGDISGGSGDDVFRINAVVGKLEGGSGDDQFLFGDEGKVQSVDGGAGHDVLLGKNEENTWIIDQDNEGQIEGSDGYVYVAFSSIDTLHGGSGADEFLINARFDGALYGGKGNDRFVMGEDGYAAFIDGGEGNDFLEGKNQSSNWKIVEPGGGSIATEAGETYVVSFVDIENLEGDGELNELDLSSTNTDNSWIIDGANQGEVNGIRFTKFGKLLGGSSDDLFTVYDGGFVSGWIDGRDGINTVDLSNLSSTESYQVEIGSQLDVDLNLINFQDLFAGDDGSASLFIADGNNTWIINGVNRGWVRGTTFTGFNKLVGGKGQDEFIFSSFDAEISGIVDGGSGNNRIDGRESDTIWNLAGGYSGNLEDGSLGTRYVKEFRGIQLLSGRGDNDTLIGHNQVNWWEIRGSGTGTLSEDIANPLDVIEFTGMKNLHGGDKEDTFQFVGDGALNGLIKGGGGTDVLIGKDVGSIWTITGENAGHVRSPDEDYIGSFVEVQELIGGSNDDHFVFDSDDALVSKLDGGQGSNRITGRPSDSVWYLNHSDVQSGEVEHGSGTYAKFFNIQSLNGNSGYENSLHGRNQPNHWLIDGVGSGTVSKISDSSDEVVFAGMTSLVGGEDVDIFAFEGGHISGDIYGGRGENVFFLASDSVGSSVVGGDDNDELILTVKDGASEKLVVEGVEEIYINGGASNYIARHLFQSNTHGILQYASGANEYQLTYYGANSVIDDVKAQSLYIRGNTSLPDEVIFTDTNRYGITNFGPTVTFSNKMDLIFQAKVGDSIILDGIVDIDGSITFKNAALEQRSGGQIRASKLYLDGTSSVGSSSHRLSTNVKDIFFSDTHGAVFINELDDLNVAQFVTRESVDIVLGGSLSSSVSLVSDQQFSVDSSENIVLNRNNRFSNDLFLTAVGSIELVNESRTQFGRLSADAVSIISKGDLYAQSGVEVSGLAVFQSDGNIALESLNNRFGSVRVNDANSVSLASGAGFTVSGITAKGSVDIFSSDDVVLAGDTATPGQLNIEAGNGINQIGDLKGKNISLLSTGRIVMDSAAQSFASDWINYSGEEVALGHLQASSVDIRSGSHITDTNGDTINVTADRLNLVAESGIGAQDALETMVEQLFVSNNKGNTDIVNGKEVWINALRSNGDIRLQNTTGNVYLNNLPGNTYVRGSLDARTAGGLADANYEIGTLTLEVQDGDLLAMADANLQHPVISARNASLVTPRGAIGQPFRPLVVYVKNNLVLVSARPSWVRYAFEIAPANIDDSGSISGDIADLVGASNEQFVQIEGLEDIDPAIFTNVRNYSFDDVSIRLPADQLYYLDDEES